MENDKKKISISAELFNLIYERINNSDNEFQSVDEYVDYVLKEVLNPANSKAYSKEEEEEIRKQLKKMGYV